MCEQNAANILQNFLVSLAKLSKNRITELQNYIKNYGITENL
jgi:hypothetical protein